MNSYVRAGVGEKLQYLVRDFNDNTIRFVLHYPGIPDADMLRRAAEAVVGSVDVLHARFVAGKMGAHWESIDMSENESCFQCVHTDHDVMSAAIEFALQPAAHDSYSQMRCILVVGETDCAVTVLMSHLCVDGGDGKYLLHKLAEAYNMICSAGDCAELIVKNGSRSVKQAYRNLTPCQIASLLRDPRTGMKSVIPFPEGNDCRSMIIRRSIPVHVMTAARARTREFGATANDLILAACYHAYAGIEGVNAGGPMSISSMMDLRRHCRNNDTEGLCNLTGALPTLLRNGIYDDFADTLRDIAAQTQIVKGDPMAGLHGMPLLHGITFILPLNMLETAARHVYGSFSVGMTNLGNIDCRPLSLGGIMPDEGLFAGPLKKKPGMQVSAASFDGACTLCIAGSYTKKDAVLLEKLLDDMVSLVADFAADKCAVSAGRSRGRWA